MRSAEGLAKLKAKIAALSEDTKADLKKALDDSADDIVRISKTLAPREDGVLQSTIKKEPGDHELAVKVVAGGAATTIPVRKGIDVSYDYAVGQEFGNAHVPAQPFFFPAVRANRRSRKNRISRAINKAAKRAASK